MMKTTKSIRLTEIWKAKGESEVQLNFWEAADQNDGGWENKKRIEVVTVLTSKDVSTVFLCQCFSEAIGHFDRIEKFVESVKLTNEK